MYIFVVCIVLILVQRSICFSIVASTKKTTSKVTRSNNYWGRRRYKKDVRPVSRRSSSPNAVAGDDEDTLSTVRKDFFTEAAVRGPPIDTKPDYEKIHGPLGPFADQIFLSVFRKQLASLTGIDSARNVTDYMGIIEIALRMNQKFPSRTEIQLKAQQVLVSLFPSWMPPWYAILFSKPFPAFSSRMNAWATMVAGTWLMGECELNDVDAVDDGGAVGKNQGLLVKRCRFLEESGCASVCVNSCKVPTQNFFMENMGLPLTMEPNYETFECQFSFGKTPNADTEILAKSTPCLARCPTAGALRGYHDGKIESLAAAVKAEDANIDNPCKLMEDK